jgi:purine-cytosine permease-like protein
MVAADTGFMTDIFRGGSAIFGPKLGTRAMVQARFSWGYSLYIRLVIVQCLTFFPRYFGSVIPSILNVFTMQAFLVLNSIIGGQTLAAVSVRLDDTTGIVIISIVSLVVSKSGELTLHRCQLLFR